MKKYHTDRAFAERIHAKLKKLLNEASDRMRKNESGLASFYESTTHRHLARPENREILFPIEKEKWPPMMKEAAQQHDQQLTWPQCTMNCYIMDVVAPPNLPLSALRFGYAVYEDKLVKCAFFVIMGFVEGTIVPQELVIDPLAERENKKPEFYIGEAVPDKKYLFDALTLHKNPLELYIKEKAEREHKERIEKSNMEAYHTQMAYEPKCFSSDLLVFAREKGWYIPPGQYND